MEIQDKIQNSVRPFLEHEEQIRKMVEISDALKGDLPSAATLSPAMEVIAKFEENDAIKHLDEYTSAMTAAETLFANTPTPAEILGNAVMKFGNYFANYQINSGIYDALSAFENKIVSAVFALQCNVLIHCVLPHFKIIDMFTQDGFCRHLCENNALIKLHGRNTDMNIGVKVFS